MNENVEASKLEDMRKSIVVSSRVRLARNLEQMKQRTLSQR